ncbi:MAG: hypothetical protein JXR97_16340 [Planctomycetes bacterium]|nr:hypothetical protein [Planctomycetota bacterium]
MTELSTWAKLALMNNHNSRPEGAPAFYNKPAMGSGKRILLGIVCSAVSVGVLFGVCYTLENFKATAIKEMKMNPIRNAAKPAPVKKKK